MDRRRFLLVLGGTTTGLVLAGRRLIALPNEFVVLAGGRCSFCLGAIPATSLAGMLERPARICGSCSLLFASLLRGERTLGVVRIESDAPLVESVADAARRSSTDAAARAILVTHLGNAPTRRPEALDAASRELALLIASDPIDLRIRLKLGDLLAASGHAEAGAAQYALTGAAFHAQGFFLKALAMLKQAGRSVALPPSLALRLADIYQQLGLVADEQAARAGLPPANGSCSFCANAPIFDALRASICRPCVEEAAELLRANA